MNALRRVGAEALVFTTALVPPNAFASAGPPADPLGFGISAVGYPSYFVFPTPTGRTVRGSLHVLGLSDRDRTVFLRVTGVTTAATGGLDYGAPGAAPTGSAHWVRLRHSRVRLPARGAVDVPFAASIPRGIRAGDHLAGLVAFAPPRRQGATHSRRFRLRFVSRLAIAVQIRVPGRLTRELQLRGAGIDVTPAGATLGLRLASTGNALIHRTTGALRVLQDGRELFRSPVRIDTFVPRTAITYRIAWPGRPVQGVYQVRGTLRPQGGAPVRIVQTVEFGKDRIEQFRRQTGRPAVATGGLPVLVCVMALLGAALAGLAGGRTRFRRG